MSICTKFRIACNVFNIRNRDLCKKQIHFRVSHGESNQHFGVFFFLWTIFSLKPNGKRWFLCFISVSFCASNLRHFSALFICITPSHTLNARCGLVISRARAHTIPIQNSTHFRCHTLHSNFNFTQKDRRWFLNGLRLKLANGFAFSVFLKWNYEILISMREFFQVIWLCEIRMWS